MGLLDFFAGIEEKRDLIVQKRDDSSFAVGIFLRIIDTKINIPKEAEKSECLESYQVNERIIFPLEVRRSETIIRLEREKNRLQQNVLKIDKYEKELELLTKEIEKLDKKCKYVKIVFKGNDKQELIERTRQFGENFGENWLKGEDLKMARNLPWSELKVHDSQESKAFLPWEKSKKS
ncbi:MAG TPA: hypothetical protein VI912_00390 [Candidatus Bilamarchaeaceae archaeon]|nr:hypothetical protein [Candidatus Bilamarchaeaceae archaeon]